MSRASGAGSLRRRLIPAVAVLALLAAIPATAGAAANPNGRFLGVMPSKASLRQNHITPNPTVRGAAVCPTDCAPLTYHNGPVQHSSAVYAFFWVPSGYYMPASY